MNNKLKTIEELEIQLEAEHKAEMEAFKKLEMKREAEHEAKLKKIADMFINKESHQMINKHKEKFNELEQKHKQAREQYEQTLKPTKAENNKMKLLITKINNDASKVNELAKQFYCKIEEQKDEIIITKNPQLTDNEFSLLAGKLVITGFNVELY